MLDITTTLNGVAVGALTSPTYTLAEDSKPSLNARQSVVAGKGGTQVDVRAHAPNDPFVITVVKPTNYLPAPLVNQVSGLAPKSPRNKYSVVVRKGTKPSTGQVSQLSELRLDWHVVAGAETGDPANLAAMLSAMIGFVSREKDNLLLMAVQGTV